MSCDRMCDGQKRERERERMGVVYVRNDWLSHFLSSFSFSLSCAF